MLTAIRGVSKTKAHDICKKFGSAATLVKHLEANRKMEIKGIGKALESVVTRALLNDS
jgi:ribosomal protein S13